MNQQQLLELHEKLTIEGRELMRLKNSDYGADNDAFSNFRMAALLRIKPEVGVLLRMQDKMARLVSFIERGNLAVKEESWKDALVDLINYSVILAGLLGEQAVPVVPAVRGFATKSYEDLKSEAILAAEEQGRIGGGRRT